MKRHGIFLFVLLLGVPLLASCGKYDYTAHISDVRSDIFRAETEEFTLTVSCVEREDPYLDDGVVAQKSKLLEAVLAEKTLSGAEYELYFLEDVPRGGEMSFRSVSGDYYYSAGRETFPEGSVSLRVVKDGTATDLMATSVKTEKTLSPAEALDCAVAAETQYIGGLTKDGAFLGEFRVRLLRRDKNYYYVGVVSAGKTLSLLLDSETGAVLARRERG